MGRHHPRRRLGDPAAGPGPRGRLLWAIALVYGLGAAGFLGLLVAAGHVPGEAGVLRLLAVAWLLGSAGLRMVLGARLKRFDRIDRFRSR